MIIPLKFNFSGGVDMNVITGGEGYPEKRNIIVNNKNRYHNMRYANAWSWINIFRQKIFKKNKKFIFKPLSFLIPKDAEVVHLFNEVASTKMPWFSTFETELPRVLPERDLAKLDNLELHRQIKLVAAPECVGIIAISNVTRLIEQKLLAAFPNESALINAKLHVLHPPQAVLHDVVRKAQEPKINFIFVGNEFYRKGGAEVVLAFSQLINTGSIKPEDVNVNLVGNLMHHYNVALKNHQDDDEFYFEIESLIRSTGIFRHVNSLPNAEVITLIKDSHVGLLPTWQDTYGFSVLEMQSCGCPVITTNVRALPEINSDNAGWIIHCPLNEMYEIDVANPLARNAVRKNIVEGLKTHIVDILQNRHLIEARSAQALERIKQQHDPDRFVSQLESIYRNAAGQRVSPTGSKQIGPQL